MDRRQEERRKVTLPARCFVLREGRSFSTVTLDLSPSGARILSNAFLAVQGRVKLDLQLPWGTVVLPSRTVWCKRNSHLGAYEAGLEFHRGGPGPQLVRSFLWDLSAGDLSPAEDRPAVLELG